MKNKRALISMTDYVLYLCNDDNIFKIFEDEKSLRNYWSKTFSYAQFLKQPLTLGMFVPVDEEGNPIEPTEENLKDYNKALKNVLFEGFEDFVYKKYVDYFSISIKNDEYIWLSWNTSKTIQDLIPSELALTESAIKKYNI